MDMHQHLPLLGGLSPQQFMRQHWQKKPLLVRQAIAGFKPPVDRAALFALAAQEQVESRLVVANSDGGWKLRHGPFPRRSLPALTRPCWTLLVQGLDLHADAVHALLGRFRFVPDARLDDVMVSYASDGGGVGPHFDSYDVFLLQASGRRRWRIGRQRKLSLEPAAPLKILRHFEYEQEFELEPGDMLYLPPRYAHEGVAVGACMTYSIGFRAPARGELAAELLQRLAQDATEALGATMYRDAGQSASVCAAQIPTALSEFASSALRSALHNPVLLDRALGEYLSEPKAQVCFESCRVPVRLHAVRLDRRTRMLYDASHVYINGESYCASGRDAALMRRLADERALGADDVARCSRQALGLLQDWCAAGWIGSD